MTRVWEWVVAMLAVIAAVVGVSWGRRKLEAIGAKKEHERQQSHADRVQAELEAADKKLDADAAAEAEGLEEVRAQRLKELDEALAGNPTQAEIQELIDGSK